MDDIRTGVWWKFKRLLRRKGIHRWIAKIQYPLILFRIKYPHQKWTEVFIVSFPKSGRTWFRVFLSSFFHEAYGRAYGLDFAPILKVRQKVPRIMFNHGGHQVSDLASLEVYIKKLAGKKIILLVRDPRDVVVSYFFQITKRNVNKWKGDDISEFIRDEIFGIQRMVDFMNKWYESRKVFKDVRILRYEDLKSDPEHFFTDALEFMELPDTSSESVKRSIEFSSFENMRKLEAEDFFADPRLRPTSMDDKNSFKTRKGKVGSYKEVFSEEDIVFINNAMKQLDPRFGYTV